MEHGTCGTRSDNGCFFFSQSRSVNAKVSRLKVQKSVYSVLQETEV